MGSSLSNIEARLYDAANRDRAAARNEQLRGFLSYHTREFTIRAIARAGNWDFKLVFCIDRLELIRLEHCRIVWNR